MRISRERQEVAWDGNDTEYDAVTDLNPLSNDTDGDGFSDGMENAAGYDPLQIASFPVWGDINNDREVDASDILLATRAIFGRITLDSGQLARANIAPLVDGSPQPPLADEFNIADLLLIQRKSLDKELY